MTDTFVDRERELQALERFWASERAQCIPVIGRRRVGKTALLERFAASRRVVYHRCTLRGTPEQLALLGAALSEVADDSTDRAEPPTTWPGVFALVERLTRRGRLLLVIDEIPYWVARDESVPSILQNWWDERGRYLDLMLLLCGSAVQMMERLLTGEAPLAGPITGRLPVRPFTFRAAAELLTFEDPVDTLTAYGVLGGIPLYLTFFRADRTIQENILREIASPTARLYVEPHAIFATQHVAYDPTQALNVLRAISRGTHRWTEIADASGVGRTQIGRVLEPLIGDLGLVERVLPVTEQRESRAYRTQYRLTDNFIRFWFRFIEPRQGDIEFGDAERVVHGIMAELSDYMGPAFEAICRDWTRFASAAGALPERTAAVGSWWVPDHEIDVVGLDSHRRVVMVGECKWHHRPFEWDELQRHLAHVRALSQVDRVWDGVYHVLFSKAGFDDRVTQWATGAGARLLTPADLLGPL